MPRDIPIRQMGGSIGNQASLDEVVARIDLVNPSLNNQAVAFYQVRGRSDRIMVVGPAPTNDVHAKITNIRANRKEQIPVVTAFNLQSGIAYSRTDEINGEPYNPFFVGEPCKYGDGN